MITVTVIGCFAQPNLQCVYHFLTPHPLYTVDGELEQSEERMAEDVKLCCSLSAAATELEHKYTHTERQTERERDIAT